MLSCAARGYKRVTGLMCKDEYRHFAGGCSQCYSGAMVMRYERIRIYGEEVADTGCCNPSMMSRMVCSAAVGSKLASVVSVR